MKLTKETLENETNQKTGKTAFFLLLFLASTTNEHATQLFQKSSVICTHFDYNFPSKLYKICENSKMKMLMMMLKMMMMTKMMMMLMMKQSLICNQLICNKVVGREELGCWQRGTLQIDMCHNDDYDQWRLI